MRRPAKPSLAPKAGGVLATGLSLAAFLAATPVSPGAQPSPTRPTAGRLFNIRDRGAVGDGATLDTAAINESIQACAESGGGQVQFPPGRYLTGTVRLQSHVTLYLDAGATLLGTTNLAEYQQPTPPAFLPGTRWGKWHRGLLLGENVEDVTIAGPGTLDGNRVLDPTGEERMRGPHTLVFVNSRRFTLRDVSIVDAANYAVLFLVSDQVEVRNVKFTGGWDGVHFRGAPGHDCRDVTILGCQFYTGDDAIAGSYWDHVVIADCVINSSCNGIRLIGPATRLTIHDCLFYGPGLQPHRTSREQRRTNMLSGIILQPGAWEPMPGLLDDILISEVTMQKVASPVTVWTSPGNPAGRITIRGLDATGVYRSALSAESWAESPITNLVVRNAHLEFAGGGQARQASEPVRRPGVDARALPAWGFYARNVEQVTFEDVRFSVAQDDFRPVILADGLKRLGLDHVRFPRVAGVPRPVVTTRVDAVIVPDSDWREADMP